MADYFVTNRDREKWAVMKANAQRASAIGKHQYEMEALARRLVELSGGGELTVQGRNHKFREKNTYGKKDHLPPRG